MHQLIYFSRNTMSGDLLEGLRDILNVSQRNNQQDGVTGSLIFDKVWFLLRRFVSVEVLLPLR